MGSKFSVSRMRKELAAQTMTSVTVSSDSIFQSGLVLSDIGTLTAAGSSQADAATIVNHVTAVGSANGTRGVKLPVAATNGELYVIGNFKNDQTLKLYPSTGSQFNGNAPDQSINITGSGAALCFYASSSAANAWIVVDRGLT